MTFFTDELGLVVGHCRGARAPKKQALLQAFTPLWLVLDERRSWHYVRHLESTTPSLPLVGQNLFAGLYLNELLYHILPKQEPLPKLYAAYVETLHALTVVNERLTLEAVLRRFEWALLGASGHQMSLTHEAGSQTPIHATAYYRFIPGEGVICASTGICGAHLLAMADNKLADADVLKAAKWMMRRAVDHLLAGRPLKSRALFM